MTRTTRIAGAFVAATLAAALAHGESATTTRPAEGSGDVAALQARVAELEAQVAALKAQLAKQSGQPDAAALAAIRTQARTRMRADLTTYSREQLAEVEQLYQPSNDRAQRGSPAVKASLEKLIKDYPKSNRAGCAVLYLAQWAQGDEREALLRKAADEHGDAFYGDGCQVGPYALFQLAQYYADSGKADQAKETYATLREKYPAAIDHGGQGLVSQIPPG